MVRISEYAKIETLYYEDLSKRRYQKYDNKTLEEIYQERFEEALGCDLRSLLCGSFESLIEITLPEGMKEEIEKVFDYQGKYQKHISDIFNKHLNLHTCYYCNIDFVNVFKSTNKQIKSGYTLDHVKPKGEYPHLALSLHNLVPSCYVCNAKLKKEKDTGDVSPTASNFDFDEKVKFKTFMQNPNFQIDDARDFDLLLKEDFTEKYKKYIDVLELDGRYEYHKYKVIEMINKRKHYPDSRIRELADLTQKTEEEVKQDLFGEYLFGDGNLHHRSFSKLTKDIAQELGLT